MQELAQSLEVLGLASLEGLNPRDLRKAFRKRSLQLLPERHPGTMNAHSTFEELNTAFLEALSRCSKPSLLMGRLWMTCCQDRYLQVYPEQQQVTVALAQDSHRLWKAAIRETYPGVITGGQRGGNGLNMKGVKGRGTKHVVHWKLGDNQLKVNLIVYDSDVMQVTGTSYYLWCLEHLQALAAQVAAMDLHGGSHQCGSSEDCGECGEGVEAVVACGGGGVGGGGGGGGCGERKYGSCGGTCTLATIIKTLATIETGIGGLSDKVQELRQLVGAGNMSKGISSHMVLKGDSLPPSSAPTNMRKESVAPLDRKLSRSISPVKSPTKGRGGEGGGRRRVVGRGERGAGSVSSSSDLEEGRRPREARRGGRARAREEGEQEEEVKGEEVKGEGEVAQEQQEKEGEQEKKEETPIEEENMSGSVDSSA